MNENTNNERDHELGEMIAGGSIPEHGADFWSNLSDKLPETPDGLAGENVEAAGSVLVDVSVEANVVSIDDAARRRRRRLGWIAGGSAGAIAAAAIAIAAIGSPAPETTIEDPAIESPITVDESVVTTLPAPVDKSPENDRAESVACVGEFAAAADPVGLCSHVSLIALIDAEASGGDVDGVAALADPSIRHSWPPAGEAEGFRDRLEEIQSIIDINVVPPMQVLTKIFDVDGVYDPAAQTWTFPAAATVDSWGAITPEMLAQLETWGYTEYEAQIMQSLDGYYGYTAVIDISGPVPLWTDFTFTGAPIEGANAAIEPVCVGEGAEVERSPDGPCAYRALAEAIAAAAKSEDVSRVAALADPGIVHYWPAGQAEDFKERLEEVQSTIEMRMLSAPLTVLAAMFAVDGAYDEQTQTWTWPAAATVDSWSEITPEMRRELEAWGYTESAFGLMEEANGYVGYRATIDLSSGLPRWVEFGVTSEPLPR